MELVGFDDLETGGPHLLDKVSEGAGDGVVLFDHEFFEMDLGEEVVREWLGVGQDLQNAVHETGVAQIGETIDPEGGVTRQG